MSVLYADASAVVRLYFKDEPDQRAVRALLLDTDDVVVTSEITRLELASAVTAAVRARRIAAAAPFLARFDIDCSDDGPVVLLELEPARTFPAAYALMREHPLRTLDAIHLAVALEDAPRYAPDERVVLVTRDADQAAAARELGLDVL